MSVSLTTDIQLEGENGPLIEPCSRGKTSPQPQGTKEGTGESVEPEDSSPQDAQVGEMCHITIHLFFSIESQIYILYVLYTVHDILYVQNVPIICNCCMVR